MPPTKPAAKQQAQETRTGDGHPGDPNAKEQAQSSRPAPVADDPDGETAAAPPLTADPNAHPQVVDLKGCARCRTNAHPGLVFHPLLYPIPDGDGEEPWTHWAACPTNGEPILFRSRELEDAAAEPVPAPDDGTA